jgi:hypothetical protein
MVTVPQVVVALMLLAMLKVVLVGLPVGEQLEQLPQMQVRRQPVAIIQTVLVVVLVVHQVEHQQVMARHNLPMEVLVEVLDIITSHQMVAMVLMVKNGIALMVPAVVGVLLQVPHRHPHL